MAQIEKVMKESKMNMGFIRKVELKELNKTFWESENKKIKEKK